MGGVKVGFLKTVYYICLMSWDRKILFLEVSLSEYLNFYFDEKI